MTDLETYSGVSVPPNAPRPNLEWMTLHVGGLLMATKGPQMGEEELSAAISMFCRALGDIPQQALDRSITEWTQTEGWRPAPADLRKLAQSFISRPELRVVQVEEPYAPASDQITPERAAEIYAEIEAQGKGSKIGAAMVRNIEMGDTQ